MTTDAQATSFPVTSVKVEKSGIYTANPGATETAEICARFRPSAVEMFRWFRYARQVTKSYWFEQLDFTPCSASGTLVTRTGKVAHWEIDASGRALIIESAGKQTYLSGRDFRDDRRRS